MMLRPPFSNYHRATLERLVQEGFERIERHGAETATSGHWGNASETPAMTPRDFQILVAAEYHLRNTKDAKP